MKEFIIFIILCFQDPLSVTGIQCLNAWEGEMQGYSREECDAKGKELAKIIERDLGYNNIPIMELSVFCLEKKGEIS